MVRGDAARHDGKLASGEECCGVASSCGCGLARTATFSLGSGDVVGAAGLRPGEHALDLGSGSGYDALRAAELVGPRGRVEGIDLIPEMVARARAAAAGRANVTFREGDIRILPFADATFDVVLTNCVVNLVDDKRAVFAEARRVLRPGGRLVLSDVAFVSAPEPSVRQDEALARACVGGAALLGDYLRWLREVGLGDVRIVEGHPCGTHGGADALAVTLVARLDAVAEQCC